MPGIAMTSGAVAAAGAVAAGSAARRYGKYCSDYIGKFNGQEATKTEMQEYASCVQYLYPREGAREQVQHDVGFVLLGVIVWTGWFIWGVAKIENGYQQFAWQFTPVAVLAAVLLR